MKFLSNRNKRTPVAKRFGKYFLIVGFSLLVTLNASAQFGPSTDPGMDPDATPPDTTVPFDDGIPYLVAATVAYGVKEWYKTKKQNEVVANLEV